jgi:hypothetical protein
MARQKWIIGIFGGGVLVGLISLLVQQYWMDLLPIWKNYRYPILENQIVQWIESEAIGVPRQEIESPNIILILADDLGFNDISFFGGGFFNGTISTPHIDSIGHNGAAFYQGYAGEHFLFFHS